MLHWLLNSLTVRREKYSRTLLKSRLRRLWTKSGKSDLFSLRPLRISAALCVERPINAEIRRGPQRKDFHLDSTFVQSRLRRLCLKTQDSGLGEVSTVTR